MQPASIPRRSISRRPRARRWCACPGTVLAALKEAKRIKSAPNAGKQPITLTLVLNRDDQKGFEGYLHDVYNAHSLDYRHFLTQHEIASRFGPSQKSYDAVLAYLERYGFKLVQGSKNRMTITVRGTRAMAEHTFSVHIANYRIGKKTFYANDRDPSLPQGLASRVAALGGLSGLARPHAAGIISAIVTALVQLVIVTACDMFDIAKQVKDPNIQDACKFIKQADTFSTVLTILGLSGVAFAVPMPRPIRALAGGPSADINQASCSSFSSGIDGSGQTIGIVAFDSFDPSDVANFLSLTQLPASLINNISKVDVNGGTSPGPSQNEVLLDIDTILTIAPGAKVVVYDAPFAGAGASFQPILNKMINDHVNTITNSFAYCEDQTTKADVDSIDSLFQQAAAAGISVFNAAGDTGTSCLDGSQNTVAVPADSPNATAVGGTSLALGPGPTYGGETWWNGLAETPRNGQGGFGVSKFFATPAYEAGFASGGRSVPDVSVNADPINGLAICQTNAGGCPTGLRNGGHQRRGANMGCAFQALLNQSVGQNLGFVNPTYYGFADTSALHSAASMGTDFAHVGLGSPNLDALHLALCGETAGPASSTSSQAVELISGTVALEGLGGVPADGKTAGGVEVALLDSGGNMVAAKTVTLARRTRGAAPKSRLPVASARSITAPLCSRSPT
jgi:subtilase family serine protease